MYRVLYYINVQFDRLGYELLYLFWGRHCGKLLPKVCLFVCWFSNQGNLANSQKRILTLSWLQPISLIQTLFNRHWTLLVTVKDQSSNLVYLKICIKQTCENLSSIGRRSCEIIMKEKHPCHTKLCVFWSDAWFRDLKFLTWGLEIKFVEIYFFLEN